MDAGRFDALARSLTTSGSRRRVLGGLLIGSLGFLGGQAEEIAAKKKKPCPPCKKRKKGKCRAKLPDGTRCGGGTCQSGSCIQTQQGDALPPPPPHVCAGKNVCATPLSPTLCQTTGPDCVCAVTADGAPFCAATTPVVRATATCGDCLQSEICMDITGCPFAPTRLGCVLPCPNRVSCTDGIQNGSESDVDCGGTCPRCANGKRCTGPADCRTSQCSANVCTLCSPGSPCGKDRFGENCSCLREARTGEWVCASVWSASLVAQCGACPSDAICEATNRADEFSCWTRCEKA